MTADTTTADTTAVNATAVNATAVDSTALDAIHKTLELGAPPSRVWAALTDPAQLGAWFPDRVDDLGPQAGAEGWLVWDQHGRYAITIQSIEPEHRLVWRWARKTDTPLEGGYNTTVEWTLEPKDDGGTTLRLVESGFLSDSDREQNVGGWKHELGELVDYLAA